MCALFSRARVSSRFEKHCGITREAYFIPEVILKLGGAEKMASSSGNKGRIKITLACTECKQRNYNTKKSKKNDPDRLEMNKFCKFCRKHTLHRETK